MIRLTYNLSMYNRLITDSNYNYYNNVDCVMALLHVQDASKLILRYQW